MNSIILDVLILVLIAIVGVHLYLIRQHTLAVRLHCQTLQMLLECHHMTVQTAARARVEGEDVEP